MKTISSSTSFREKFDYLSTALAYCWLIWIAKARHSIQSYVYLIMRLFVYIFLPQKYLDKFDENHMDILETQEILFGDWEGGHDLSIAQKLVYNTFTGYLTFPITIVAGIICSFIGWNFVLTWQDGAIFFIMILIWGVLVFTGLGIFTKVLDNPLNYIPYFKKFKNQDKGWHKRWKRYTILLFLGSIISAAMSFGFGLLCIDIDKILHAPM